LQIHSTDRDFSEHGFSFSKHVRASRHVFLGPTAPQSFCHSLIALPMIRCSKSAQKSAVHMCQVATVVMKTKHLVLSQFKNFYRINGELNKVSLCAKNN